MMRPFDTMQLGWRAMATCDLCQTVVLFHVPADLRKCHWWYVIEATSCRKHRRSYDSVVLYGRGEHVMGTVQRLS